MHATAQPRRWRARTDSGEGSNPVEVRRGQHNGGPDLDYDKAVSRVEFLDALGQWCSGVSVVTVSTPAGSHGATVSAFSSVSIDPPLILVGLSTTSRTGQLVQASPLFAVNILAADQHGVSDRFAGRDEVSDRFKDIPHRVCRGPSPADASVTLICGCIANLVCRPYKTVQAGDHVVCIAEVCSTTVRRGDPLLYFRRDYRQIVYGRRSPSRESERLDPAPKD